MCGVARSLIFVWFFALNQKEYAMAIDAQLQIHLARKWRSAQFERIVGQDLAVRILKNSLFTNKLFPVYLFAGQHGCGKTTTARVFAAALNCALLPDFQKDPKARVVPCLQCPSCQAMAAGKHPDFIEIDAASHTGVDNVRQIVEAASLLPLNGRKKVYLIDEAHMLSKAAFNAFLKILEEPPASVLFILATTDEHKIIETVKSRCFQLFFNAVNAQTLHDHLMHVCQAEAIPCQSEGLQLIVRETGGSVRDALNVLEQVYLSAKSVNYQDVVTVLGYAPSEVLVGLFERVVTAQDAATVLHYVYEEKITSYNADYIWQQWIRLVHSAISISYGLVANDCPVQQATLEPTVKKISPRILVELCQLCYIDEPIFVKTANKAAFIPFFLLKCWQRLHEVPAGAGLVAPIVNVPAVHQTPKTSASRQAEHVVSAVSSSVAQRLAKAPAREREEQAVSVEPAPADAQQVNQSDTQLEPWQRFLALVEKLGEPLLSSIFKQGAVPAFDADSKTITVHFAHRMMLFNDTINQFKRQWEPVFIEVFGVDKQLQAIFVKEQNIAPAQTTTVTNQSGVAPGNMRPGTPQARASLTVAPTVFGGRGVDVSDKERWPLSNALLQHFSGTIVSVHKPQSPADAKESKTDGVEHE